ncbi:hypothetical protein PtrV1_02017 [Pyrenophora tritici-repentis]|nr:hypothetical protein PtrV1_02017 [Pyrenophora tritici-repentis]KAF7454752.1 hypothetical protein A1F99_020100 [Pyrenophora tritici-repentis]PZD22740.1 hypothetical protein A1F96_10868 [Pyrenophora tritici-repentis]
MSNSISGGNASPAPYPAYQLFSLTLQLAFRSSTTTNLLNESLETTQTTMDNSNSAMSTPEPPLIDKHLQRFCWLLHFQHISKLLAFQRRPILIQNRPDLQRARNLFFEIIDQQLSRRGPSPHMRTASTYTWLELKYEPLLARGVSPWDPQFDERPTSQLPNPATETFPEGGEFWAGQPMTDLIRHQRFHILDGMRRIIYASRHMDRADEVAKVEWGLEKMWHYMMWMMGHAQYFVYGHAGKNVYGTWTSLYPSTQANFIKQVLTCSTLVTGGSEIETYVSPSQVELGFESEAFMKDLFNLAHSLEDMTLSYCEHVLSERFATACFTLVPVPAPSEDRLSEEPCTVCMEPYHHDSRRLHFPDQRGDATERNALWDLPGDPRVAIKTLCEYALCLGCLRKWIWSGSNNSELCPHCRGDLKPGNPAPKLCAALMAEVTALQNDTTLTPLELTRRLIAAYDTFTIGLLFPKEMINAWKDEELCCRLQDLYQLHCEITDTTDHQFRFKHTLLKLDTWFLLEKSLERLQHAETMAAMNPAAYADMWPSLLSDLGNLQASQCYLRASIEMQLLGVAIRKWEVAFEAQHASSVSQREDEADSEDDDFLPTEHGILGLQWNETWGGIDRDEDKVDDEDEFL